MTTNKNTDEARTAGNSSGEAGAEKGGHVVVREV